MPSNLMKLSSSSMESEFPNHSDFDRSGSFDSQGSHSSRSRSYNLDDENLKYLTSEEKNVLMFLEETLDAFEEDLEEPYLSLNSSSGYYSPRSAEDSNSDPDDIIDLVHVEHNHVGNSIADSSTLESTNDTNNSSNYTGISQSTNSISLPVTIPVETTQKENERFDPDLHAEHRKFLGAVPTPVIIAQKISERKSENENLSPLSPKQERSTEQKKSVATSPISEDYFIFPGSPNNKQSRFPSNINIKLVGKHYNETIAKAAVNVQERKAQVLANLHGPTLFTEEIDGKAQREPLARRTSIRDVDSEQTRYEALTKLGLVKEIPVQADIPTSSLCTPISNGSPSPKFLPTGSNRRPSNEHESISQILMSEPSSFVSLGKTVFIKGETFPPLEKNKRHSSPPVIQEQKPQNLHQDIKRSYSMPRPTGFRPQGITVQFSGRDSSEESKKDALRRLGLLKELSWH